MNRKETMKCFTEIWNYVSVQIANFVVFRTLSQFQFYFIFAVW